MVYVSWNEATAYAEWARKRLPTEAEWEKAARSRLKGQRYVWGDDLQFANHHANFNGKKVRISGMKQRLQLVVSLLMATDYTIWWVMLANGVLTYTRKITTWIRPIKTQRVQTQA